LRSLRSGVNTHRTYKQKHKFADSDDDEDGSAEEGSDESGQADGNDELGGVEAEEAGVGDGERGEEESDDDSQIYSVEHIVKHKKRKEGFLSWVK
jgi:hypothetical protein